MLDTTTSQVQDADMPEITPELAVYFNKKAGQVYDGFIFGGMVDNWAVQGREKTGPQYSPLFLVPTDSIKRFRVVEDGLTYADSALMKNNGEVGESVERGEAIKHAKGSFALPSQSEVVHLRQIIAQEKQALIEQAEREAEAVPVVQEEPVQLKKSWLSRVMPQRKPVQTQTAAAPQKKEVVLREGFAGLKITWQDNYATSMMRQEKKRTGSEMQDEVYLAQLGGVGGSWESVQIERVKTGLGGDKTNLPWLQSFNVRLVAKQPLANQLFKGFTKSLVV